MKVRVFSIKYILVRREETLELDGRSMKIPRKSQNQSTTSETTLAIYFPGNLFCLPWLMMM